MLPVELNILTLNIWGIPLVSSDRQQRVTAIGAELSTGRYDIVSLQEVWSQTDYETLVTATAAVLPYAHYFYSGVIGAGLLVLSKYPIIGTLFHAWSVNGYFHRVQHADWFGGKGVGLCRILVDDQVVHLYNAHLHAEYNNENDDYKTHRVIQAFDTAQFIRATRGEAVVQILAGDLNAKPDDISYKVLLFTSKMSDSCSELAVATNECQRNSYTAKRTLARNPHGIRIDHIFVRSAQNSIARVLEYTLPLPDRVPGQKFSYSDHEAVLTRLGIAAKEKDHNDDVAANCLAKELRPQVMLDSIELGQSLPEHSAVCSSSATTPVTAAVTQRIGTLHEAIALCESSLQQLKIDRILYYSIAIFLGFFLIALAEYSVPIGFKTLYLLLKFVIFAVIAYCLFMGAIWNYMERHGVLAGKTDMEVMLRCAEKFELGLTT